MFIPTQWLPLRAITRFVGFFAAATALLFTSGCRHDDHETLRLVILTGGETDVAAVDAAIERASGGTADVSPLFPDVDPDNDPESLAQMFLAIVEDSKSDTKDSWDRLYELEDATGYARIEPDTRHILTQEYAANRSTCFLDEDGAPSEKDWSLVQMGVREAWAMTPQPNGRSHGEGIRVCHPDTGWTHHQEMNADQLDLANARNFLNSGPPDARDPLDYSGAGLFPGHGTGTGTVIVSDEGDGEIDGVAPKATLVPIRTAKSVIQVFDSDLAKSVRHATTSGCDVVSMSLGGVGFFGLSAAIRDAKRNNVIVMAAAGNCVRFVSAPASYENCIAVAATGKESKPWKGSSRGDAVDVSAPGEFVWTAHIEQEGDPLDRLKAKQGTSFAVANTAGVAALWLAHHDLNRDTASLPENTYLQDVFLDLLKASVTIPDDWASHDGKFGDGIVSAKRMLEQPIPDDTTLRQRRRAPLAERSSLALLADVIDHDLADLTVRMQEVLNVDESQLPAVMDQYGSELIHLAMRDPEQFRQMLSEDRDDTAARRGHRAISSIASERLRNQMQ